MKRIPTKQDRSGIAVDVESWSAHQLNSIASELDKFVVGTGQTPDTGSEQAVDPDSDQVGRGITISSQTASEYGDSGSANAYVLNRVGVLQQPAEYLEGMRVNFQASNTNTGPSTANLSGIGVKKILTLDGSELSGGEIQSGSFSQARYSASADGGSGAFQLISFAVLDAVQNFTRQQYFGAQELTIDGSGNIAWNCDEEQVAYVTLTRDSALLAPTNMRNGGRYRVVITQDGTGGWSLGFASGVYLPARDGDTLKEITTGAGESTLYVFDSDGTVMRDFSDAGGDSGSTPGILPILEVDADANTFVVEFTGGAGSNEIGEGGGMTITDRTLTQYGGVAGSSDGFRPMAGKQGFGMTQASINSLLGGQSEWTIMRYIKNMDAPGSPQASFLYNFEGTYFLTKETRDTNDASKNTMLLNGADSILYTFGTFLPNMTEGWHCISRNGSIVWEGWKSGSDPITRIEDCDFGIAVTDRVSANASPLNFTSVRAVVGFGSTVNDVTIHDIGRIVISKLALGCDITSL